MNVRFPSSPRFAAARLIASLALSAVAFLPARASDATATPSLQSELKALVGQVKADIAAGKKTDADLAPDLAAFDKLLDKYQAMKNQSAEDLATIPYYKAMLYMTVLNEPDKAKAVLMEIKTNFPGTKAANLLAQASGGDAASQPEADAAALVGQQAPDIKFIWSSTGKLANLASLKGKVIVVDFWATWCGPCIHSFPHLAEMTERYKGCDVVVVGVTSLQGKVANLEGGTVDCSGDPAKEESLLPEFMKEKDMTWTVAVSDDNVFNPNFAVRGIPHMAVIDPKGVIRVNGLHPSGEADAQAAVDMVDSVLKEFKMKGPPPATVSSS